MSTNLRALFLAADAFRADRRIGEPWDRFDEAARAYVTEHREAVIVAQTDWGPLDRATRYRWGGADVIEEAVRVTIQVAPAFTVAVSSPTGTYTNLERSVVDEEDHTLAVSMPSGHTVIFDKDTRCATSPGWEGWSYR